MECSLQWKQFSISFLLLGEKVWVLYSIEGLCFAQVTTGEAARMPVTWIPVKMRLSATGSRALRTATPVTVGTTIMDSTANTGVHADTHSVSLLTKTSNRANANPSLTSLNIHFKTVNLNVHPSFLLLLWLPLIIELFQVMIHPSCFFWLIRLHAGCLSLEFRRDARVFIYAHVQKGTAAKKNKKKYNKYLGFKMIDFR